MWATKNPLRALTYFCKPRSPLPAPLPLRDLMLRSAPSFFCNPAHRSAPHHPIFGFLRSALHSDNKVNNIQN